MGFNNSIYYKRYKSLNTLKSHFLGRCVNFVPDLVFYKRIKSNNIKTQWHLFKLFYYEFISIS